MNARLMARDYHMAQATTSIGGLKDMREYSSKQI